MARTSITCAHCATTFLRDDAPGNETTCPACGSRVTIPSHTGSKESDDFIGRVSGHISRTAGVERLEGFSLQEMFSEVFTKHSDEEVERYFTVGSTETTPPPDQVDTRWPKPWVFFRMFVIAVIVYLCFVEAWNQYGNVNLIPGIIMVGSFAVPFSTLVFFFEVNARRNVSLYQVNKLVLMGGVLSIIFSLVLFQFTDFLRLGWLGASVAGLAEEPGKLLALTLVISKKKYPYLLNGLLFGAAIGTGFAAFESAGYALRTALEGGTDAMMETIQMRGLLSPFSHIVWTAMSAGALWRVKGNAEFQFSMLNDMRFKRVFFVGVILHMLWNSAIELPFNAKYFLLGAIAWIIVLGLIQEGLKELEQRVSAGQLAN